jgi:integrase
MKSFASPLGSDIARFLAHKRGLGFAYHREEWFLHDLDRIAATRQDEVVSEALVREYLAEAGTASRTHRLTVARQLARFLAVEEPSTFIPPARFLGTCRQRSAIRVLTREEAGRFLDACDALPSTFRFPHRGLVHGTALRVLLLTGLRRSELLTLKVRDVDVATGIITVHRGKFGKSRFVPIAVDLIERLDAYQDSIGTGVARRSPADPFFPSADGRSHCSRTSLYKSFRQALETAGIHHGGRGRGPRLHDLRHTFAVLRLLAWYEEGADLNAKLPLLATYLGHVGMATTQVYLHMTLDLVGEVTRRQLDRFGDLITAEVDQ